VVLPELEEGSEVLLDDGKISLTVTAANSDAAKAVVQRGGVLTGRKSVKLPGKTLRLPVLTERDLENIRHAAEFGFTGLLQPFVHSGEELKELKAILADHGAGHVQVFAKIETMEGFANLESILPEADVIVIARGDLGNDMPLWQLPAVQKEISAACRAAGKPFIVKGIMTPAGARKAVEAGASGIVVSNHGGRVQGGVPSTAEVLPAIADAVKGKLTIFVDGGIRSGVDVYRALALGADAVLIGRPVVPFIYAAGAEGLKVYLDRIIGELTSTMTMCGTPTLKDIGRDNVILP
jgi:NAD(P)H-dependent flavin oxidoreductase YrpB (nitropropane dioxygenase family)